MGAAAIPHLHDPMGRGESLRQPFYSSHQLATHFDTSSLKLLCVVPLLALFVTRIEVWVGLDQA